MKQSGIFIICALLMMLTACTGKPSQSHVISVTIEPQRYFAEKIAGDKFVIHVLLFLLYLSITEIQSFWLQNYE